MVSEHYSDEVINAWVERIYKYHAAGGTPQQQIEMAIRQAISGMSGVMRKRIAKRFASKDAEIALLQKHIKQLEQDFANKCIECGEAQERAADLQWRLDDLST